MALQDFFETFVLIEKKSEPDGMGGFIEGFIEGAEFKGYANLDTSSQAKIAQQDGLSKMYTVTVPKNAPLKFNDYIKRKSDGQIIQIKSDENDIIAPKMSTLDIRQYNGISAILKI